MVETIKRFAHAVFITQLVVFQAVICLAGKHTLTQRTQRRRGQSTFLANFMFWESLVNDVVVLTWRQRLPCTVFHCLYNATGQVVEFCIAA